MENNSDKKTEDYKDRFKRWQQLTINQLSITNNLFLTFTTGFLAFCVTRTGIILPTKCCVLLGFILGYSLLIAALISGTMLTMNRLKDFRKTKELIKLRRQKHEEKNADEIENLKNKIIILESENIKIGVDTWKLFKWQVWTFISGCIVMLTMILITGN